MNLEALIAYAGASAAREAFGDEIQSVVDPAMDAAFGFIFGDIGIDEVEEKAHKAIKEKFSKKDPNSIDDSRYINVEERRALSGYCFGCKDDSIFVSSIIAISDQSMFSMSKPDLDDIEINFVGSPFECSVCDRALTYSGYIKCDKCGHDLFSANGGKKHDDYRLFEDTHKAKKFNRNKPFTKDHILKSKCTKCGNEVSEVAIK